MISVKILLTVLGRRRVQKYVHLFTASPKPQVMSRILPVVPSMLNQQSSICRTTLYKIKQKLESRMWNHSKHHAQPTIYPPLYSHPENTVCADSSLTLYDGVYETCQTLEFFLFSVYLVGSLTSNLKCWYINDIPQNILLHKLPNLSDLLKRILPYSSSFTWEVLSLNVINWQSIL